MLCERTLLHINDLDMNHPSNIMHVVLNVIGPLSVNQLSKYMDSTLVVTKYDIRIVKLNPILNENVLQPNDM